ncbi:probable inactive receptor-like protein kinase At3g56050 isoform X2 [Coffea arabica]|uniref:Probable inactive receptor-like protein kinase At3g56050 isoform X2 n=2 Tax=Coffea arabica TaxID=13443 RepID=A0ABM4WVA5_COFAR
MVRNWKWTSFQLLHVIAISTVLSVFQCKMSFSWSLNNEGLALLRFKERVVNDPFNALRSWKYIDGDLDPCSWFGVECSDGNVITLTLRDLCLEGTLAPELGQLTYLRYINLRNNSFSGIIPKEIGELKELEVLDLGYNNFTGPFPLDTGNNISLLILLLDNNEFISGLPPEINDLKVISESQVDENQISSVALASSNRLSNAWETVQYGYTALRRLLQGIDFLNPTEAEKNKHNSRGQILAITSSLSPSPSPSPEQPFSSISVPPSTSTLLPTEAPSPSASTPSQSPVLSPNAAPPTLESPPVVIPEDSPLLSPSPALAPTNILKNKKKSNNHTIFILSGVIGGSVLVLVSVLSLLYCRSNKVVTVKPWATGLSGQLQKAFVTGVPKLQRSELEAACEDFSNIIASLSDGTVYKGTLSSGVEIAVTSTAVKSAKDWSKNLEAQFRNKIDTLSKVNHKNFVNLIGFCEEQEPFARMMVFEYAPNGTLFEHLHIKESEHLDWATRLRIAVGMAYCLEYMHQLNPPIAHCNLQSSSVYLTEDYAAKISDLSFWNEVIAAKIGKAATVELLETTSADPESNIYNFGVILLEMITGRLPYSVTDGYIVDWALNYFRIGRPLRDIVDPTLYSFREEELEKLIPLVKDCLLPNPEQRPRMREIAATLKEITALDPDGATPKSSPLWWAELEILSTVSS